MVNAIPFLILISRPSSLSTAQSRRLSKGDTFAGARREHGKQSRGYPGCGLVKWKQKMWSCFHKCLTGGILKGEKGRFYSIMNQV